jgi:hypothetical protein
MLAKHDEDFLRYWSEARQDKKKFLRKASIGLPLGVFIALGLGASLIAAYFHRKANPILHDYAALVITVMIAGVAIAFFITLFGAHHKWDQNELHYDELMARKEKEMQQKNDE